MGMHVPQKSCCAATFFWICGSVGAFYTIPYREKKYIEQPYIFFLIYKHCVFTPTFPTFPHTYFLSCKITCFHQYTYIIQTILYRNVWEKCGRCPTKSGKMSHLKWEHILFYCLFRSFQSEPYALWGSSSDAFCLCVPLPGSSFYQII